MQWIKGENMFRNVAIFFGVVLSVASTRAALLDFALQGQAGSGLLPGNEPGPASGSTASGSANGPIQYDPVMHQLTFDIDFSNIHQPLAGATIRGPADQTSSAAILYDLVAGDFLTQPGANSYNLKSPGAGGTLTLVDNANGSTFSIAQQETQLSSGLWYIQIAGDGPTFSMGEIRGNLVAVPEPVLYVPLTGAALALFGGMSRFWRQRRPS
jgi:hypothetical protein